MLGANLVCFQVCRRICPGIAITDYIIPIQQTYSYFRHFMSTCVRVCGYESSSRGIDVEGHVTAVMHCPVGIDAERVARDM